MNTCFAEDLSGVQTVAPGPRPAPVSRVAPRHEFLWVCRIGGRVVGAVELRHEGPDTAEICLFRVDPEWQHTSVPRKLLQCVRGHSRHYGLTRISMEPRMVPRWLLQSLRRRGFRLAGYASPFGKLVLEFHIENVIA